MVSIVVRNDRAQKLWYYCATTLVDAWSSSSLRNLSSSDISSSPGLPILHRNATEPPHSKFPSTTKNTVVTSKAGLNLTSRLVIHDQHIYTYIYMIFSPFFCTNRHIRSKQSSYLQYNSDLWNTPHGKRHTSRTKLANPHCSLRYRRKLAPNLFWTTEYGQLKSIRFVFSSCILVILQPLARTYV